MIHKNHPRFVTGRNQRNLWPVLVVAALLCGCCEKAANPSKSTGLEPVPTQVLPDATVSAQIDDLYAIVDGLCEREDQLKKRCGN